MKARRSRSLSLVVALSSHLANEVSLEDDGIVMVRKPIPILNEDERSEIRI